MSSASSQPDEDPLTALTRPPPNETADQRAARLAEEAAAKKVSDDIDEQIRIENKKRKARAKREIKILLLGQSESGKSTCLKQFQLLYSPQSFAVERDSWKAVIYLNLVKSVRQVLDAISPEEESFSDGDAEDSPSPPANDKSDPQSIAQRAATPVSFSPTGEAADERVSTDDTYSHFAALKLRLSSLAEAEELLIRRLAGPDEDEATHLGSWNNTSGPTSRMREVFVRSGSNWKKGLFTGKGKENAEPEGKQSSEGGGSESASRKSAKNADDPFAIVKACEEDIQSLWKDQTVQAVLEKKGIRLQEMPGFYLNDISRVLARNYTPSNQDVLTARLKTVGVIEHLFQLESSGEKGVDWRIYDVGGHRDQRQTWAPFFDDVNAIIFLAPISAFDQVLVEDRKINRIEDSLLLFRSVCANKLLANVNIVLFLNKIDILQSKLNAGVRMSKYVRSFGERPNDYKTVSQYFLSKFIAIHNGNSPTPGRELYAHLTAVVDTEATASLISDVWDMILRKHLQSSALL